MRKLCLALWTVVALGVSPAAAESEKTVLLLDSSSDSVTASLRSDAIGATNAVLSNAGGFRVIVRQTAKQASRLGEIKHLLGVAEQQSQRFKEQDALNTLSRAESIFRRDYGAFSTIEPLVRLLLTRARLQLDVGRTRAARQSLARIAVLRPKFRLSRSKYRPTLVQAYDQERARSRRRKGTLRITSSSSGTNVYVDGKRVGTAPTSVKLAQGEHFVAVGDEGATNGQSIEIRRNATASVNLDPPAKADTDDNGLRKLGNAQSADWVLTVSVIPYLGKYQIAFRALAIKTVDVAKRKRSETTPGDKIKATIEAFAPKLTAMLSGSGDDSDDPDDPTPGGTPVYKKWWFWTIIGTAVAGGAAAGATILIRQNAKVNVALETP